MIVCFVLKKKKKPGDLPSEVPRLDQHGDSGRPAKATEYDSSHYKYIKISGHQKTKT